MFQPVRGDKQEEPVGARRASAEVGAVTRFRWLPGEMRHGTGTTRGQGDGFNHCATKRRDAALTP